MRTLLEQVAIDLCRLLSVVQSLAFLAKLAGLTQYGWAVVAAPMVVAVVGASAVGAYGAFFLRQQRALLVQVRAAQAVQAEQQPRARQADGFKPRPLA